MIEPRGDAQHVYLHVPFCRSRCPYCDYATTLLAPSGASWATGLSRELELRAEAGERLAAPLRTLHLGGGTPSLQGDKIPDWTRRAFAGVGVDPGEVEEWGVEANPEDLTLDRVMRWGAGGVTRVVVGVQSLRADALRFLGRVHSPEHAIEAMRATAAAGLRSWGVDLLWGLPASVEPDPLLGLEPLLELGPPHIGLFELTVEPGTPLADSVARGEVDLPDPDRQADLYLAITARLKEAGYRGIEPTAFARPGHGSKHARAVRSGESYMGLGPGAHSFLSGERSWNFNHWPAYLEALARNRLPREGAERPDPDQRALERLWSDLGSDRGLGRGELGPEAANVVSEWSRAGWARTEADRIRLTPEGWIRLDALVLELSRFLPFR